MIEVQIYMPLDCSSDTVDPWTIATQTETKIKTFLATYPGSTLQEKFERDSKILEINIIIPVASIDAAKAVETKLKAAKPNLPPVPSGWEIRFNYINQEV